MQRSLVILANKRNVDTGLSPKGYGRTYFAKKTFQRGETVMFGYGKKIDHQTSHFSVQIDRRHHYLPQKWTGRYWNHSCSPNTFMKTGKNRFPYLVALKKIKKGDEITYAYWMSEQKWEKGAHENVATCLCGEAKCRKKILSFSQLSEREKSIFAKRGVLSRYLSRTVHK